jgi:hypothetical protein
MSKTWGRIRIRIGIKMESQIRIGIKTMPIHKTGLHEWTQKLPNEI